MGFPSGSVVKNPAVNAGDVGLIPRSGRCPGAGEWQPTPVFLPGNLMDRGDWWASVHRVAKSQMTEGLKQTCLSYNTSFNHLESL